MERFKNWLAHPFRSDGTAVDWLLFLGLVIIAVYLWNTVLMLIIKRVD